MMFFGDLRANQEKKKKKESIESSFQELAVLQRSESGEVQKLKLDLK